MRARWVRSGVFLAAYGAASWGPVLIGNDSASFRNWAVHFGVLPQRAYTVPVAYLLVGRQPDLLAGLQTVVGGLGWLLLLHVVWTTLRTPWLRVAVPAVLAAYALTDAVTGWNRFVLSEALSIGLLPWAAATGIVAVREPTRRNLVLCWLAVAAWTFTRQAHLIVAVAALLGLLVVTAVRRRGTVVPVTVGVAVMVVLALPYLFDTGGKVAEFNEAGLTVDRVLVDDDLGAWFTRHGQPVSEAVAAEAGHFGFDRSATEEDEALTTWNREHFVPTYADYLVRHPVWAVSEPWGDADVLGPDLLLALMLVLVTGLGLVAAFRRERPSPLLLVPAGLVAVTLIELYVNWHLSATELTRLNVTGAISLRLALLLTVGWLLDQRVQGGAASGSTS